MKNYVKVSTIQRGVDIYDASGMTLTKHYNIFVSNAQDVADSGILTKEFTNLPPIVVSASSSSKYPSRSRYLVFGGLEYHGF